ncbi:hypothetical protein PVK06_008665 [Gossypium arboreum]|uniref:RNase H type-1 domain-containing protein n=1 Tax=Gossypium arboreum TaxID=29729 RepID=A0ABR0QKX9_GOSAR|nr:hypothetical protein PVK06_008665 [Gossypium arboreum]
MKSRTQVGEFVLNYLKELEGLNLLVSERRIPMVRWVAPIGSRVKINFDATFNRHKRESCFGLVVRNEKAEVICSSAILNVNIPLVFAAEVRACLQALDLGLQLRLREVEVEGDS